MEYVSRFHICVSLWPWSSNSFVPLPILASLLRQMIEHSRQWALQRGLVEKNEVHGEEEWRIPKKRRFKFKEQHGTEVTQRAGATFQDFSHIDFNQKKLDSHMVASFAWVTTCRIPLVPCSSSRLIAKLWWHLFIYICWIRVELEFHDVFLKLWSPSYFIYIYKL